MLQGKKQPSVLEVTTVVFAFAFGTVAAWWIDFGYDLQMIGQFGWCSLMIAWFPPVVPFALKRSKGA